MVMPVFTAILFIARFTDSRYLLVSPFVCCLACVCMTSGPGECIVSVVCLGEKHVRERDTPQVYSYFKDSKYLVVCA